MPPTDPLFFATNVDRRAAGPVDAAVPERIEAVEAVPFPRGRNGNLLVTDRLGRRLMFKHNTGGAYRSLVGERERRRRDVANIVASHLLAEVFATSVVRCRDAILRLPDGRELRGVVADWIDGLRPFHQVDRATIVDRDDALRQIVGLAWLGDLDRIETPDNETVTPNGRYLALDFDFCFRDGVSFLGIPAASRRALARFLDRPAAEALIAQIAALSDAEILATIDGIGRARVADWSEAMERDLAGVLIRNRDRLVRSRALWIFSPETGRLRRLWADFVTRHVFLLNRPLKPLRLVAIQGPAETLRTLLRHLRRR